MQHLIDIFLKLVEIDGVSGRERQVGDFISAFLSNLGLPFEEDASAKLVNGNCGNIICRIGKGGNFILASHMDTARSTNGIKPIVADGKITSDGTTILGADNRAGVAVILYSLQKMMAEKIPAKDFTAVFTVGEETTLFGSKNIKLDPAIQMGFVFDSSFRPGYYVNQAYGAKNFRIDIKGRAAHSGIAPEKGINAIKVAGDALAKISVGRLMTDTTLNIGKISGGNAVNVIPEEVVIEGEIRSSESSRVDEVIEKLHNRFEQVAEVYGAGIKFNATWDFEPFRLADTEPVIRQIKNAIRRTNLTPFPVQSPGGSDANSLNAKGIPSVNIGIGAQNPHANDEFILIEDLHKSAAIAWELIRKL